MPCPCSHSPEQLFASPLLPAPRKPGTMSEKKVATAGILGPMTVDTVRLPVLDISIAADSGWRELDQEDVDRLTRLFREGDYGVGILTIPSVQVDFQKKMKESVADGRALLNNGKSTVAALQQLAKAWSDDAEGSRVWASEHLEDVFRNGLRVDLVMYPTEDSTLDEIWNALAHDTESNKCRSTAIHVKIDIVKAEQQKVPGGDYGEVVKSLLNIYGQHKKSVVDRWVLRASAAQNYVFDHKYRIWSGPDAKFRLKPTSGVAALQILYDKIDGGEAVNMHTFVTGICAPVKVVESWNTKVHKEFGKLAESSAALKKGAEHVVESSWPCEGAGVRERQDPVAWGRRRPRH